MSDDDHKCGRCRYCGEKVVYERRGGVDYVMLSYPSLKEHNCKGLREAIGKASPTSKEAQKQKSSKG